MGVLVRGVLEGVFGEGGLERWVLERGHMSCYHNVGMQVCMCTYEYIRIKAEQKRISCFTNPIDTVLANSDIFFFKSGFEKKSDCSILYVYLVFCTLSCFLS